MNQLDVGIISITLDTANSSGPTAYRNRCVVFAHYSLSNLEVGKWLQVIICLVSGTSACSTPLLL